LTVKEAILSYPGLSDISDDLVEKVLADRSVNGADSYVPATHAKPVALAAADLYVAALSIPDFSEGKLSVKMPRGEIRRRAMQLYLDNGQSDKADDLKSGKGNAKSNAW